MRKISVVCLLTVFMLVTSQGFAASEESNECPYMRSEFHSTLDSSSGEVKAVRALTLKRSQQAMSLAEVIELRDGVMVAHDFNATCMTVYDKITFRHVKGVKKNMAKKEVLQLLTTLIQKAPLSKNTASLSKEAYLEYIAKLAASDATFKDGVLENTDEMSSYGIEVKEDGVISIFYEQHE